MDRRAACMTYEGKHYDPGSALRYFEKSRERLLMHPNTEKALGYLLTMLRDQGEEETFRYIRESVLKNKPLGRNKRRPRLAASSCFSGTIGFTKNPPAVIMKAK